MIYLESPFAGRDSIGHALTFCGLTGLAVEVGTHRGEFAKRLLDTWPGVLHCVDPWADPPGYEDQAKLLATALGGSGDRQEDYLKATEVLKPFIDAHRCRLVRKTSQSVAPTYFRESLDFVYIDGDHQYGPVFADLSYWWPKVKVGGFLAGHDVVTPDDPRGWQITVRLALERFCAVNAVAGPAFLIPETGLRPWSFMIQKKAGE